MAADTEILREFLVKLGFKTDDKSLKSFSSNVESATKLVMGLATAIAGSATLAAFQRFASGLEGMYYASKKAGASVTGLKAFEKAARNFGASSEDALQSVQSLARWMRDTPGSEGFLKGLGVNTRDANGRLKETTQIMTDLGRLLGKMNYPMARQYGNLFGIGEDTLRAIMSGEFSGELEKQKRLLDDAGYDKAAEDAAKFQTRIRELATSLEVMAVRIEDAALKWVDRFAPAIKAVSPFMSWLVDMAGKAANKIGDLAMMLMDFGFRGTAGAIMLGRLAAGDINGARAAAKAMSEGMESSIGKSGGEAKTQIATQSSASGSPLDPVRFFMGMGWSKDQAAGIVANLQRESGMRANAVGDNGQAYGIAQWHPDRQANFAKWAGKDIRNSTVEEQMRFVNYELTQGAERRAGMLLRAAQSAEMAGIVMSKHYERPRNAAEEAAVRGAAAVQIAQNTTINVNGGDAAATGRAVANEQNSVNQNLARNLQTAVN